MYTVVLVNGDKIRFKEENQDEILGTGLFLKNVVYQGNIYKKIYVNEKSILVVLEQ